MKILCKISVLLLASWILFKNEITSSSNKPIIFNKDQMVDNFIKTNTPKKEIKVRLTAYWAKGSDTDSWSARRQSSTGATLKPNRRDEKNGYLLTQSILSKDNMEKPYMRSYYFIDKEYLKEGYLNIMNKIDSSEKIFYLLRTNKNTDYDDSGKLVEQWKKEVKDATKETQN